MILIESSSDKSLEMYPKKSGYKLSLGIHSEISPHFVTFFSVKGDIPYFTYRPSKYDLCEMVYTMRMISPLMTPAQKQWFIGHDKLYTAVQAFYGGKDVEDIHRWTDILINEDMRLFLDVLGLSGLCR